MGPIGVSKNFFKKIPLTAPLGSHILCKKGFIFMAKRNRIRCLSRKWEKAYKKSEQAKVRRFGKRSAKRGEDA